MTHSMSIDIYFFTGFTPPDPGCKVPLGVSDREIIPDAAMSASSRYNDEFAAQNARLRLLPSSGVKPGWAPKTTDRNQFLQVSDIWKVSK